MKKYLVLVGLLLLATSAHAERITELNGRHVQLHPTKQHAANRGSTKNSNLSYHNGPVLHQAKVVAIFWGPTSVWGANGSPSQLATHVLGFFGQFGRSAEYNVITQYYDFGGSVQLTDLGSTYWIDNSTPPTNVTDATVQSEVLRALGQLGHVDGNTVYEVFLPPSSYASYGSSNSCGGPNLQFCAYHSNFVASGNDIKYASMPYPSCGGCRWPGWTDAQNFEHFACHETREAVTDPDGNGWWDRQGYEADDKCAWSPSPFVAGGYGYQYEWSNLNVGCVQTR
jgi:hypothetical protein